MSTRRSCVNMSKPKVGSRERRSPNPKRTKTPSSNEIKNKYKFSPKGKRKLDFPFKGKKGPGPLAGKLFYLDLAGYRQTNQLKKTIAQLGGKIEECFGKEVTYLVTKNEIAKNGKSPSSQSAGSPDTPSPLPLARSSSMKSYAAASPMSTDSPQGLDTHLSHAPKVTTRGKSIVNRCTSLKKGTTDIMSNATTWGVKVFHVDFVLKWISRLLLKANQQSGSAAKQKTSSPLKRVGQTKVPKVVALQETYIKVEDLSFKYRPLVSEFKFWPEITFNGSNVCPFDPPRRKSSENSAIKKKSEERATYVKKPVMERPKSGYCECCEVRYADLDLHLRGKQHKEFARKDLNYVSLDKAISEGFKLEDLLEESRLRQSISSHVIPAKKSMSVSSEDTDELCSDDVFLLSTPRSSRRNQKNVSDCTPPNKRNIKNNEEYQKKTSPTRNVGEDIESLSKSCTSKKREKIIVSDSHLPVADAKDMTSPLSRPITRLRKASSNLASPIESKHLSTVVTRSKREASDEIANILTSTEHSSSSKNARRNKRKSVEITERSNQSDVLQCSNNLCEIVNTGLENVDNEHTASRRRTRNTITNFSVATKIENQNNTDIHLSQENDNNKVERRNRPRSKKKNKIVRSKSPAGQSGEASSEESEDQQMTSKQDLNYENTFQDFAANSKNEDEKRKNYMYGSKRPKRIWVDFCNESSSLDSTKFGDNGDDNLVGGVNVNVEHNDKVGSNQKSVVRIKETDFDESKEYDRRNESEHTHNFKRSKRNNTVIDYLSDAVENQQYAMDSPRLKTPSKSVSNDNILALCPGGLNEREHSTTVRSVRRRKSNLGVCELSPISPCNLNGDYSAASSCAEDTEYLPSGLSVYSSLGSSLGGVCNDVNGLVDVIEKHNTDDDTGNHTLVGRETDTLSSCAETLNEHTADVQISSNVRGKEVVHDKTNVENTELQVALTYLNVDTICAARSSQDAKECSVDVKRKRNLNDEEPTKARKWKRLSEREDMDSQRDNHVKSLSSLYVSECGEKNQYHCSVAESVKLNRAILESLQKCSSPTASEPEQSPRVQRTGRKRKNALMSSSPFAEITNTDKRGRERAKSERKMRTSARSFSKQNFKGTDHLPRSACFMPNDPFRFDGY